MREKLKQYHRVSKDPAIVILLILPVFLVYAFGQFWASPAALAGVDVLSIYLRSTFDLSIYIGVQAVIALSGIAFAVYRLRGTLLPSFSQALPAIAESAVYGLALGTIVLTLMEEAHLLSVAQQAADSSPALLLDGWVAPAGAALHEEFLFRLLLIPILALIGTRVFAMPQSIALLSAAVGSSLIFAGAHHWIGGETYSNYAFAYRSVAGLLFAGLQIARGFAVSVWTHAVYDFYVTG